MQYTKLMATHLGLLNMTNWLGLEQYFNNILVRLSELVFRIFVL